MYLRETFFVNFDGFVYNVVCISRNIFNGRFTDKCQIAFYNFEEDAIEAAKLGRKHHRRYPNSDY